LPTRGEKERGNRNNGKESLSHLTRPIKGKGTSKKGREEADEEATRKGSYHSVEEKELKAGNGAQGKRTLCALTQRTGKKKTQKRKPEREKKRRTTTKVNISGGASVVRTDFKSTETRPSYGVNQTSKAKTNKQPAGQKIRRNGETRTKKELVTRAARLWNTWREPFGYSRETWGGNRTTQRAILQGLRNSKRGNSGQNRKKKKQRNVGACIPTDFQP